ncbi:hypothetical protein SNE40_010851 [Patella caerulea]|uniref:Uncharacterized protein n=1 Tax=Patella caerulea TaxID=87958 RepID=A0AAN8JV25_PATCE
MQIRSFNELKEFIVNTRQASVDLTHDKGQGQRKRTHVMSDDNADSESDSDGSFPCTQKRNYKIPKIIQTSEGDVDQQIDDLLRLESEGNHGNDESSKRPDNYNEDRVFEESLELEYFIKDTVGEEMNIKVAGIIDNLFTPTTSNSVATEEKMKELMTKFPRPANLNVNLTSVNKEVWSALKPGTRSNDIKMQKIQERVIRSTYALARLDRLMEMKKSGPSSDLNIAVRSVLDCLTLMGSANQELNQRRRDHMRIDLPMPYKLLCNPSNATEFGLTNKLFGCDLAKRVKELKDSGPVNASYGYSYYNNSVKGASRYNNQKGKSFLYQKRYNQQPHYRKPWKSQKPQNSIKK